MSAHYPDPPRDDDAATGGPPADFSKATPRPWRTEDTRTGRGVWIVGSGDENIAYVAGIGEGVDDRNRENAALLVAAVNERGPLLDLLAELLAYAKDAPPELQARVAKVLAAAEGRQP